MGDIIEFKPKVKWVEVVESEPNTWKERLAILDRKIKALSVQIKDVKDKQDEGE